MLDTVVPEYLQDDDLGAQAPSGERALGLVRGYATWTTTRRWRQRARQELARRGYGLTEVPIPVLLIVSVTAAARPAGA